MSFTSIKVGALPPADEPPPAPKAAINMTTAEPEPRPLAKAKPVAAASDTAPPPARLAPAPPTSLAASLEPQAVLTRIAEPAIPERNIYRFAAVASVLWFLGLAAIAFGYVSRTPRFQIDLLTGAVAVLVAAAPLGLIWAVAYAVAQARILAVEARRAKKLTDELVGPTALAAAQAGAVVEAMRGQIATASEVANQACEHLTALRDALVAETERLAEATAGASRSAVGLVESLSRERAELNTLAVTLDARANGVTEAINRQARMVAEASDLAETQLRESEAALAARAADLAAAAGEAVDVSRVATEDLGRQVARLETASAGVGDQMRSLEDGLTEQRAALVTVAHALRAEQEDFSTLAESSTAQLAEFVSHARQDVAALNEATNVGASSLSGLIGEAREKFRELAAAAVDERDSFVKSAEDTLKTLSDAGAREREYLETAMRSTIEALSAAAVEAREAADVHAEAARARVDLLNEAAFTAGQQADKVLEDRLVQAQGMILQSGKLVEDAGEQAVKRLEAQVEAAQAALQGLNGMIDEVAARAARLPEETGAKAEEIRAAVERGLGDLLDSARRAAEETQAIDAAFHERVKRNYEMLSEAVQLMGVVAHGGSGAAALQRPSPAERVRSRLAAAHPPREAAPAPGAEPTLAESEAAKAALRGRLKLAPTASEEEFKSAYEAASGQPAPEESGWTWKELLTTLDESAPGAAGASGDPARLGGALFAEIEAMGIDPNALLPKGRIEEISAAIQTGDAAGAREVVRTLAPAAIRRIARRSLSDADFRGRSQGFVARFGEQLGQSARHDKQGYEAAGLLASNGGRAYLLLDAAAGQPG